jgi:hypothetical protein
MPHPSHRTSRTDLVYGSCILHIPSTYYLNADEASHPVLTYSIRYQQCFICCQVDILGVRPETEIIKAKNLITDLK